MERIYGERHAVSRLCAPLLCRGSLGRLSRASGATEPATADARKRETSLHPLKTSPLLLSLVDCVNLLHELRSNARNSNSNSSEEFFPSRKRSDLIGDFAKYETFKGYFPPIRRFRHTFHVTRCRFNEIIRSFSERYSFLFGIGAAEKRACTKGLERSALRRERREREKRGKKLARREGPRVRFKIKREKRKQREVEKARAKERYGRHAWSRRRPVRKQTDCFAGSFVMRPWHINYFPTGSTPLCLPHSPTMLLVFLSFTFFFPPVAKRLQVREARESMFHDSFCCIIFTTTPRYGFVKIRPRSSRINRSKLPFRT